MTQYFAYSEYGQDLIERVLREHKDEMAGWVQEVLLATAATEQNRDNDIEDYLSQQTYVPSISVVRSTNQAMADGGAKIQFEGIQFQSTSIYDWVSSDNTKLTAAEDGIALITGFVKYDTAAGGDYRTAQIYVNGADIGGGSTVGPLGGIGAPQATASTVYSLLGGDYVELFGNQNTGAPLNVTSARLSVSFLGRSG